MRVDNIQYLRGIAALVVLIAHCLNQALQFSTFAEITLVSGHMGVAVFFAVSGFIMFHTTSRRETTPREFMKKRLIRIAPLYWIATCLAVGLRTFEDNPFPHWLILPSLTFFPVSELPVLGVGWTLNYEMAFYLAFALTLFLPKRFRLIALFVGIGILPFFHQAGKAAGQPWRSWTDYHMWAFLAGVGVGMVAARVRIKLPSWVLPAALAAPIAIFAITNLVHVPAKSFLDLGLGIAIVAACVVAPNRLPDGWLWRHLERLGDASYALYLFHPLVGGVIKQAMLRVPDCPVWIYPVLMIPASMVTAWWVHIHVEKPIGDGLTRGFIPTKPMPVVEAA